MNIIVAVDENWGIGKNNALLDYIPEDLKYFKEKTTGKVVIMGRKTFESFPKKEPLPNRLNIILTRDTDFSIEGAVVCSSIKEALAYLKNQSEYLTEDIFFIGGESIYKQAIDYCDTLYITKIHKKYDADRFFPEITENAGWEKISSENHISKMEIPFSFEIYKRKMGNV